MIAAITAALSAITAPIGVWLEGVAARRRIKEEGKVRIEVARVEAQLIAAKQEAEYDVEAQRQMQYSWKDEYLVIVFSFPFILSFLAPFIDLFLDDRKLSPAIALAWSAVSSAPHWYQWALLGMIAATFGLRWLWTKDRPSITKQ